MQIPALTTEQMIEVDRLMIEEYGIKLIQMMENAGSNLARLALRTLEGRLEDLQIVVLCGSGNNGGGGMVAARHLHNWGLDVRVALAADERRLKDIPRHQWGILKKMGLPGVEEKDLQDADLILDAMIGYGLQGNPRRAVARWIDSANETGLPILALDAPSGINTTFGIPGDPCIRASATLTLALPKMGLLTESSSAYVGELYLADISVPPQLYQRIGIEIGSIFLNDTIIRISEG
jgi:NAD(P)H-hydrate epimerase